MYPLGLARRRLSPIAYNFEVSSSFATEPKTCEAAEPFIRISPSRNRHCCVPGGSIRIDRDSAVSEFECWHLKDKVNLNSSDVSGNSAGDKFDDEHYPAYNIGTAAQMLGATPGFLRSLDEANLLTPHRSDGGHRRYSRYQLRIASRVRDLLDRGTALDAACRIIELEDQLADARSVNSELQKLVDGASGALNDRVSNDET